MQADVVNHFKNQDVSPLGANIKFVIIFNSENSDSCMSYKRDRGLSGNQLEKHCHFKKHIPPF